MAIKSTGINNKNILVASESQVLHSTKRLLIESKKLKYPTVWLNPYESMIPNGRNYSANRYSNGLFFHRTSGTRYDDFDLTVARYHEDLGLKITNPLIPLSLFRSKDEQGLFFKRHDIPSVQFFTYRGALNEKYWSEIKNLSPKEKYVLKMIRGNQGIGVNLIESAQSLKSLLETFNALKDQKFIIQPFVPHKKEWRLFVIKDDIVGIVERTISATDFRGNSKRSCGKFIRKIPREMQDVAMKAMQASGLDYCGMDVMESKDGYTFLEINPVPGFMQMEELSGVNIARELITRLY